VAWLAVFLLLLASADIRSVIDHRFAEKGQVAIADG
jgi:hypothetical protein